MITFALAFEGGGVHRGDENWRINPGEYVQWMNNFETHHNQGKAKGSNARKDEKKLIIFLGRIKR